MVLGEKLAQVIAGMIIFTWLALEYFSILSKRLKSILTLWLQWPYLEFAPMVAILNKSYEGWFSKFEAQYFGLKQK